MRNTILKWVILTALAAYAAIAAVWAGDMARQRPCRDIAVSIKGPSKAAKINPAGVLEQITRFDSRIIGKPLDQVRVRDLERRLAAMSNFESVECYISSGGKLCVDVVPMIPEIRVFDTNGRSYYINKDGKRIEANASFFVDVPIVTGRFSKRFTPKDVLPVVRFVQGNKVLRDLVTMIEVRSPNDILLIPRIKGHIINFGNTDNLDSKFHNLMLMYRKVLPYKGWNTYDTISVKFRGQIVATRRDKTIAAPMVTDDEDISLEEASLPQAGDENADPFRTQQPEKPHPENHE